MPSLRRHTRAYLSQGDVKFRFCEPHADAGSRPVPEGLHQKPLQFGLCLQSATLFVCQEEEQNGSCLKTGQHSIFVIIYPLLPIKCIIFVSVSKILFIFFIANNNYDSRKEKSRNKWKSSWRNISKFFKFHLQAKFYDKKHYGKTRIYGSFRGVSKYLRYFQKITFKLIKLK